MSELEQVWRERPEAQAKEREGLCSLALQVFIAPTRVSNVDNALVIDEDRFLNDTTPHDCFSVSSVSRSGSAL